MTNQMAIPGQINLFDYLKEVEEDMKRKEQAKNVLAFPSRKDAVMSAAEDYLKKGERLTTLAREKYARMVKKLSFSKVEEKMYSLNVKSYKHHVLIPKIATSVIRPLLKGLTTFDDSDDNYKLLKQLVDFDITLEPVSYEISKYIIAVKETRRRLKTEEIVKLTVKEEGYEPLEVYGAKDKAHTKTIKSAMWKYDNSLTGDIAEIMAWLIVLSLYNRALENEDLIPLLQLKFDEGKYPSGEKALKTAFTMPSFASAANDFENIHEVYEKFPAPLGMPLQKFRWASDEAVAELCKILGYDYQVEKEIRVDFDAIRGRNLLDAREGKPICLYQLTREIDLAFKYIDPVNWSKVKGGKLIYHDFLDYHLPDKIRAKHNPDIIPDYWPLPKNIGGQALNIIGNIDIAMDVIFEDYKERVLKLKYLEETKTRARAWQTKKNIPEKVLKAAKESILNDYFGFIEFDEETDLSKVAELVDEFIAFKETYLKALDTKNITIRFRKLGNHKAFGLYCYEIGCLCVDFRHPDSFVHEYGHCIDHTTGDNRPLSDETDFYRVYYEYKKAFRAELSRTGKVLKGKYDFNYYTQKTEVFARSMEMYVTRTLGMHNSICTPDEELTFAYPKDEALMEEINAYFSKLFESLNTVEEVEVA